MRRRIKNNKYNEYKFGLAVWIVIAMAIVYPISAYAQGARTPSAMTQQTVSMLEERVDQFSQIISRELDRSKLNGTEAEDMADAYVDELELSTDRLRRRADDGPIASDVTRVLGDALRVESFLAKNPMPANVTTSWTSVKMPLDQLAKSYNIAWVWKAENYPGLSEDNRERVLSRLEESADEFEESFDNALEMGRADGTTYEEHMVNVVKTLENSLDNLAGSGEPGRDPEKDVLIVLNNARAIEDYMRRYKMTPRAVVDWYRVRANLDDLARMYKVAWVWAPRVGRATIQATDAKKPNND